MKNILHDVIDFIFPRVSIISGSIIEEGDSSQYFKDDELENLEYVTDDDLSELSRKLDSDFSFSLFAFREGDNFSRIIYQMKYGGMRKLGILMGKILAKELEKFINSNTEEEFGMIIPVPLFKTRQRERGYNQSESIAAGLSDFLKVQKSGSIVKRVRHTTTQTALSREERMKNIYGAFEISGRGRNEIQGKAVILVDDVVTTGSTMNEVIKVLRENDCGIILACSLAMAR